MMEQIELNIMPDEPRESPADETANNQDHPKDASAPTTSTLNEAMQTDAETEPASQIPHASHANAPTQGALANTQGNLLESTVHNTFTSKGFRFDTFTNYAKKQDITWDEFSAHKQTIEENIVLANVPYTSVYNHKGKTEFLVISKAYNLNVRIECKWQQSKGSVDEKLPYLYLNCIESMPEDHIMIVIDGNGFKQGAVQWLKDAAAKKLYQRPDSAKRIDVFSLSEFIIWANRVFR